MTPFELYAYAFIAIAGVLRVLVSVSYSFTPLLAPWDPWLYALSLLLAIPLFFGLRRPPRDDERSLYYLSGSIRFGLIFMMGVYGLSKVLGQQFTLSYSDLDHSVGEASGAVKTWAFFGHSFVYEALLGWGEVVGAILLLFYDTVLPGAFLLAIMLVNIVIINFTHDIGVRANSSLYLAQALALIWPERNRIWRFLRGQSSPARHSPRVRVEKRILLNLGRFLSVAPCAAYLAFNQWMIFRYKPAPHPLVGIWRCSSPCDIVRLRFDNDRLGSFDSVAAERVNFSYQFDPGRNSLEIKPEGTQSSLPLVFTVKGLSPTVLDLQDQVGHTFAYKKRDAVQ